MSLKFCKLKETAVIPEKQTKGAGGYDLYSIDSYLLGPETSLNVIPTGIAVIIPEGYVGIIKPRSSLAAKYGIRVEAGVIDSDYRGEIKVLLNTRLGYEISPGDRIAQLIVIKILEFGSEEISLEEFQNEQTHRGTGGFGSTGL